MAWGTDLMEWATWLTAAITVDTVITIITAADTSRTTPSPQCRITMTIGTAMMTTTHTVIVIGVTDVGIAPGIDPDAAT